MIRSGRFAGLLAVMLIPVMLIPIVMQNVAARFGWPALVHLPWPMPAFGVIPAVPAAVARVPGFWRVALLAALAAWVVWRRHGPWRRIVVDHGEAVITPEYWPEMAPDPMTSVAAEIIARVPEPVPVEGADLAARARFVAMSFAFPDASRARASSSRGDAGCWPLHIVCHPTRFTLTLQHAALGYRLEFCNRGAEPLGPLMIRANLSTFERTTHGRGETMPLCHYLDSLAVDDSVAVTGELRLPLTEVAAVRLGSAELLVPMMHIFAESVGDVHAPLSVSARFAIGMPPLAAGGGIQPFRLDTGPGIWRNLSARRSNAADLSQI